MCSDSGITYVSPCLAGCLGSSGYGKNTVGPQERTNVHCSSLSDKQQEIFGFDELHGFTIEMLTHLKNYLFI